jgi:hypothetical protein
MRHAAGMRQRMAWGLRCWDGSGCVLCAMQAAANGLRLELLRRGRLLAMRHAAGMRQLTA